MANTESKLWHLEQVNLLKELSPDELQKVSDATTMKVEKKGKYIYFPQEPSQVIFFLKAGRVKIGSYSDDGKEIIKTIVHPGEVFGEMGIVGQENRKDFAMAMDDEVRICAITVEEIKEMMSQIPHLSFAVTKVIGERLIKVERKLESMVFKDVRTRLLEFLKDTASDHGKQIGHEVLIQHNLTHQDIANLIATSRQTVTTILNDLKEQDLIYMERNKVLIRDLSKLK